MKQKTLWLSAVLTAFFLGALSTYILMTKQQMDQLMQAKQASSLESSHITPAINAPSQSAAMANTNTTDATGPSSSATNLATPAPSVTMNDYTKEQALEIVNKMPDYVLGQYVDKFMTKDASNVITDKRRFAQRAIEELYKANDNQPLKGEVRLSLAQTMPANSVDTSSIGKNAKLFAHLDTQGQVPASPYVFIKWVNNETGQVLLFEKKNIVADSNQNWVSFRPYEGWQPGSYDIRFYQFTSELQPVAQLTYNIYSVTE
ncbi:MAG: hypothetical protein Q4P13_04115 [Psychrobacter sp.]|nr:hypothetical protein [Psychrobacter sp.]